MTERGRWGQRAGRSMGNTDVTCHPKWANALSQPVWCSSWFTFFSEGAAAPLCSPPVLREDSPRSSSHTDFFTYSNRAELCFGAERYYRAAAPILRRVSSLGAKGAYSTSSPAPGVKGSQTGSVFCSSGCVPQTHTVSKLRDSHMGSLEKVGFDSASAKARLQGYLGRREGLAKGRLVVIPPQSQLSSLCRIRNISVAS